MVSVKSPTSFFVTTALAVATVALALYTERRLRRRRKSKDDGDAEETKPNLDFREGSEEALVNERFQACVKAMGPQLSGLPQPTQLDYYGLYKQGTLGDCREYRPEPPPSYDLVGMAKYKAWARLAGMDRMTAMQTYIEKALHFEFVRSIGSSSTDDENYELEGDAAIDVMGLGDKPSTLVNDYDKEAMALEDSRYPIHAAAREGDLDGLNKCLAEASGGPGDEPTSSSSSSSSSSPTNALDTSGQTPLHLATDRGHIDCVKALILAGAHINAVDHDGISILQTAVIGGDVECCRLLLALGADPDHADHDGDTPRSSAQDDASLKELFRSCDENTLTPNDLSDQSFVEEFQKLKGPAVAEDPEDKNNSEEPPKQTEREETLDVKNDMKALDEQITVDFDDDGDMF